MHTLQSTTPAWYSSEQVELAISPATARLLLEQALASGFDPATDPARMITLWCLHPNLLPLTLGENTKGLL